MNLNINESESLLISLWNVRDQIVPCFLSSPGIGKTSFIYAFRDWIRRNTDFKESKVVEVIASQILPNEVSGITMPNGRTKSMEVYDHKRLSNLKDGDILFFDELLQGSPQVLSACLTLIQERRMMSGKDLPDIMIIAAANPTVSPSILPAPVRDRFFFVNVRFDGEEWQRWMLKTRGVKPNQTIVNTINKSLDSRDSVWNELTPRDATKLFDWYLSKPEEISDALWCEQVYAMYSSLSIGDEIVASCKTQDVQRQVVGVIDRYIWEHEDSEEYLQWINSHEREQLMMAPENKIEEFVESFENSEDLIRLLSQISYNKEEVK